MSDWYVISFLFYFKLIIYVLICITFYFQLWKNLDIKINSGKIKNNEELKLINTHLENSRSIVQILHKLNQVFKNLHLQKKMLPLSSVYQFYEEAGVSMIFFLK